MGSDGDGGSCSTLHQVSIHAPAWGATLRVLVRVGLDMFQSTLPHGERLVIDRKWVAATMFQSTLPHGERQIRIFKYYANTSFNPRSRMGSDIRRARGTPAR